MLRKTTKDYSGRQLDIEVLKHVEEMLPIQKVFPDIAERRPRIVSGIEKAVQRYAKLFLTVSESVKLAGDVGSEILTRVAQGQVSNIAELNHLYAIANRNTLAAIRADDADTDVFGTIPDDERITSTTLKNMELDYGTRTVRLHILLTTAAGDSFTFVIPVGSGIR